MAGARNIRLTVEYKGTGFAGWQIQAGQSTVQGEITEAIRKTTGREVSVIGAGRTDAGVHAMGQVANFRIEHQLEPGKYRDALNYYLPADIRIRESFEVPMEFHARRSARWKRYRYVIAFERSALWREYRWELEGGERLLRRSAPRNDREGEVGEEQSQDHKGPDVQEESHSRVSQSLRSSEPDLREEPQSRVSRPFEPRNPTYEPELREESRDHIWDHIRDRIAEGPVDIGLLREAAGMIVGEHDFAPFCVTASRKEDNRCRIDHVGWRRVGPLLVFEIRGNRFLHNMVRSLVGAMVNLASRSQDRHPDNLTLDRFADIIQAPKEQRIVFTAPARGLYLVSVHY